MRARLSLIGMPVFILAAAGCTTVGSGNNTGLTTEQQAQVNAATQAVDAFGSAVSNSQGATGDGAGATALPRDLTCPTITFTPQPGGTPGFTLAMDFGTTGCSPLNAPDFVCSGAITGTVNRTEKTLSLAYSSVGCGTRTLSGSANLAYARTTGSVTFDGTWTLNLTQNGAVTSTTGNGSATFDRESLATTVTNYSGSLTTGGKTYQTTMNGIQVSYLQYSNFIPFSGSIIITSAGQPTNTITFNTDSPTTHTAQVTVGSLPVQAVDLP